MKGLFIFSMISLSTIEFYKRIHTLSLNREVSCRYLVFAKHLHGVGLPIGTLFHHVDFPESAPTDNFNDKKVILRELPIIGRGSR